MPENAYYVIMTHNHPLDFAISEAILKRNDAHYIGLIGSKTKWKRFQMRFQHKGYTSKIYNSISCPVGHSDIPGKLPAEVAVSVAGEIISLYHQQQSNQPIQQGIDWRHFKPLNPNTTRQNMTKIQKFRELQLPLKTKIWSLARFLKLCFTSTVRDVMIDVR